MLPSTKLGIYNITSKAALKCGSEVWVVNKQEYQKLEIEQIKFLRALLGLTRLDHQRNTIIREKLKVEHIVDDIKSYKKNWLQHVKRMEHARVHWMALEYKPKGKSDIDRPETRWRVQQHLQD